VENEYDPTRSPGFKVVSALRKEVEGKFKWDKLLTCDFVVAPKGWRLECQYGGTLPLEGHLMER